MILSGSFIRGGHSRRLPRLCTVFRRTSSGAGALIPLPGSYLTATTIFADGGIMQRSVGL